jgi:hypothetical protein
VYRIFEGAVAKPILALQDNIPDDIYPEVTIKDFGLLVRAPVAAIATVPYILSAGVWLFMAKVFSASDSASQSSNYISAFVDKEIPLRYVGLGKTLPEQNRYTVPARPGRGGLEELEISSHTELRSRKGNCRVRIAARRREVQKGERGEG